MVRTSGIRKKFRSNALNLFKQEKNKKCAKKDEDESDSEEERREQGILSKTTTNSLLSILPKPKNGNTFGPTVKLGSLLKMPERAKEYNYLDQGEDTVQLEGDDGIVEFDVRKLLTDPVPTNEPVIDGSSSKVVVPKGKEKQKNQITYLAQLSKATELERKEHAAQGRFNKSAARAKYGW